MALDEKEVNALIDKVGDGAVKKVETVIKTLEEKVEAQLKEIKDQDGFMTKDQHDELIAAPAVIKAELEEILKKQGLELAEVKGMLANVEVNYKSVGQVLTEDMEKLQDIYNAKQGVITYQVTVNEKGQPVMRPYDATKAAGPHATVDDVGGGGNIASIASALDPASILRMGADGSQIFSQYRNTPYIFDLCNTRTVSVTQNRAVWIDELPKVGASTEVAEGDIKPISQYLYQLNSDTWKKEATLISITEEFAMDFPALEADMMGKGLTDVINRINAAILPDIATAAVIYDSEALFLPLLPIGSSNQFDVIAAMSAQVDSVTFGGAMANAALMNTGKKYRIGVNKDLDNNYQNPPDVISNVSIVGNPSIGADDIFVGDFKQYNIDLRGGFIIRVGFNADDFARNKFSVVMEQPYFNYISNVRKPAIVKGPTFAAVQTLITAA